jgi:hypothetical protein
MLDIYLVIQLVLLLIGLTLLIKGALKLIKYYKIDILLSILIRNELPNTNKEKGKKIMDFFHKRRRCITKISYLNWRRFRCMGSCKLIRRLW